MDVSEADPAHLWEMAVRELCATRFVCVHVHTYLSASVLQALDSSRGGHAEDWGCLVSREPSETLHPMSFCGCKISDPDLTANLPLQ